MSTQKNKKNKDIEHLTKEEKDSAIREETTKRAEKDMFLDIAPYLIIIAFIVIIRTFIATPVTVSGSSMSPTLEDGDTMILYKLTKSIRGLKRGDMVVVETSGGKLIKRIIALPGETITYKTTTDEDGKTTTKLYIDGKEKKEKYIDSKTLNQTCAKEWEVCITEIKIPEEEYYVLGDNRDVSRDSRMIGSVHKDDILGTTELVLFPFSRFGIKE